MFQIAPLFFYRQVSIFLWGMGHLVGVLEMNIMHIVDYVAFDGKQSPGASLSLPAADQG